jgi:type II secretory pathway component PulF
MDLRFPTLRAWLSDEPSFRSWWPWRTTAAQRLALLRLIAVGLEENVPLGPLVATWADDERGVQRRRLRKLARLLNAGRPLAEAVEEVPGVLSEDHVLAIRFDAQSGTRTATIRSILDDASAQEQGASMRVRRAIVYFWTVLPLALLTISFIQIKIVPVLLHIFEEFGMYSTALTLSAGIADRGASGAWWISAVVLIAVLAWLFATRSGRSVRHALFGRLIRPLHQLRSADVLQKLAVAADAGRPLPGALSTLARYHYDPGVRQELLFVRNELEQGVELWQSMVAVGFLTPAEAHLLRTSQSAGNRPWALKQIIAVKRRRTWARLEKASEFMLPALVLLMAGLVVFQAMSVFEPLVELIDALG